MKRNRIISALLAFFMAFTLIGVNSLPAYAVKSGEVGISLSDPKRSYNSKTGKYGMELTLKNNSMYYTYNLSAYLYNADGKLLVTWKEDGGKFRVTRGESSTINFVPDYSKYSSSSFTFVYKVKVSDYYNADTDRYENPVFTWKWTIKKDEASGPSMKFKALTYQTMNNGTVAPRINVSCKNMKGQTLKYYVYDEYGDLVNTAEVGKRDSNDATSWFYWNGKKNGQQYPDGYYTVKVKSSGGLSISKQFYLDFPYNGYYG
ncbi:MAG: hypothetical protein ACI4Q4_05330 [Oscillospiraceae bacterium]